MLTVSSNKKKRCLKETLKNICHDFKYNKMHSFIKRKLKKTDARYKKINQK